MTDRRDARLAAGAGVLFVAVMVLAPIFAPPHPGNDATTAEIARHFAEHRERITAEIYVVALAMAPALVFLVAVWHILREAEGAQAFLSHLALVAGTVTLAVNLSASAFHLLLTVELAEPTSLGTVELLFDLGNTALAFLTVPLMVLVAAVSLSALRTGVLPRWVSAPGFVVAALQLLASPAMFVRDGAFAPNGPVAVAAIVALLVWALALCVAIIRRTRARARPAAAVA